MPRRGEHRDDGALLTALEFACAAPAQLGQQILLGRFDAEGTAGANGGDGVGRGALGAGDLPPGVTDLQLAPLTGDAALPAVYEERYTQARACLLFPPRIALPRRIASWRS